MKSKQEFFDAIIDITRQTGQGLSGIVCTMEPLYQKFVDELLKDGLITKHERNYSHIPDDVFYFPKGCYNYYTDAPEKKEMLYLSYVRVFLKIEDLGLISRTNFMKNKELMKGYPDWLLKNRQQLEALRDLKTFKI